MTITTTNESTVSFDNARWSIGLARQVEWVRLNREDNLAVVQLEDGHQVGREVTDLVAPYRPGTVVSGRRSSDNQLVQGLVTERSASGLTVWTSRGVDWYGWEAGAADRWSEVTSVVVQELVRSFWQHHQETLRAERRARQQVVTDHEVWKSNVAERLHTEANDRNYCEDFDDIMAAIGLPRREYDYDVEVDVTTTTRVVVRARGTDVEDAMQNVEGSEVREAFRHSERRGDWSEDWSAVDAEKS
ncbi:hypothetical protein AB0P21_09675 [Kribbella sp. NPDC056861]|uniref:hypothetical protein n=1 Tax=Kribbella sp. NPDC056861 TaxID=3154857 RepID=UPI003415D920